LALVTGRATTGIKITPQAILRFVAPHGLARNLHEIWHGASVPSAVPNFRLGGGYLGFPAPKNEKLPKLPTLSPRRGDKVSEIRRVYESNRSTEVNIWCDPVGKLGI